MLRLFSVLLILLGLAAAGVGVMAMMSPEAPTEVSAEAEPRPVTPRGAMGMDSDGVVGIESLTQGPAAMVLQRVPIAHESPEAAVFGEVFDVTLSIDATGAASAIAALPGRERIVEGEAQVSSDVRASLTGSGFDITAQSPEDQAISPLTANTWRWEVMPERTGPQDLILEIYALVDDRALPVRTFRDTVTVEVSAFRRAIFFAQAANPLVIVLSGIGSVLGGAFTALRFFKR